MAFELGGKAGACRKDVRLRRVLGEVSVPTPQQRQELTAQVWEPEAIGLPLATAECSGSRAASKFSGDPDVRGSECHPEGLLLGPPRPGEAGEKHKDESGRVRRVDWWGKKLGAERPFKRLLQNQFS